MKSKLRSRALGPLGRTTLLMLLALVLPVWQAVAQAPGGQPEMAEALRQSGKIYVVVAVIAVVLTGILLFLISLDRKLSRLEKEIGEER